MDLTWSLVFRIVAAALLGGILGIERTKAGQSAGIRTNIMIATASCLFTYLGAEAFAVDGPGPRDPARVAAQIVSGVGFLGAGTLLQTKNKVRGLTTAATIWLVAAIGMTVGVGLYWSAIFVTIFGVTVLSMLAPVSNRLARDAVEMRKIRQRREKEQEEELKHWWDWRKDDDEEEDDDDEDDHLALED